MLDTATYTPRLKADFKDRIRAAMREEFGYTNDMQIPRLDKIVLNIGCGAEAVKDSKKSKVSPRGFVNHRRSTRCCNQGKKIDRGLPCS
jgi:large subunit ribosomal protein L5